MVNKRTRPLGANVVVIKRAPLALDTRDNSLWRDWDNATFTTVRFCLVEPFPLAEKLNFEINRDREFSQSAVRIYMPPETDCIYTDRIEYDGYTWNVLGHPAKWIQFDATPEHLAVIAQIRHG